MRRRTLATAVAATSLLVASCGDESSEPIPTLDEDVPDETAPGDRDVDEAGGGEAAGATSDDDDAASSDTVAGDAGTTTPDVVVPDAPVTDLVVTDVAVGSGKRAEAGDTLSLYYVGVLGEDGTAFDSNFGTGEPLSLVLGSTPLIEGFTQGLVGVQAGGVRQLDIPAELAYGDQGVGDVIPPGAAISFVVEIVSVTEPVPVTVPPMADPSECPATDGTEPQQREFDEYPPFCIDVDQAYTAEIVTNFGEVSIALDPARAPLTVNNFVTLARYKYFDGTECHRAIPGFVVQCGDPTATGTGGPGYSFPDELPSPGEYRIGSLAMANSGPDTNGSQFFIITGENGAALPPQYSLFGEVIGGLDTTVADLDAVANPESNGVPPLERIVIESITITES